MPGSRKRSLKNSTMEENLQREHSLFQAVYPQRQHTTGHVKDDPVATPVPVQRNVTNRYVGNDGVDDTTAITDDSSYTQTLLWVHQTEWQRELLKRYGNTISLIDATYKTTRYELALFFICVRTNVGYSVVAEFVVQSENSENIQEALTILTQWNSQWKPRYFMSDYSEAELSALEAVFPSTTVYLTSMGEMDP